MFMRGHQLSEKMIVKIPYELKLRFLNLEGLESNMPTTTVYNNGNAIKVPSGYMEHDLKLELDGDSRELEECKKWIKVIETYFKTSYGLGGYKIDIGPYEGLWPTHIDYSVFADEPLIATVHFRLDNVNLQKRSWKDWFIREETIIAPK